MQIVRGKRDVPCVLSTQQRAGRTAESGDAAPRPQRLRPASPLRRVLNGFDLHKKIVAAANSAEVAGLLDELPGWDSHIHGVPNPDYLPCVNELVELHDCWLMPEPFFRVRLLARPGCVVP